jgi:hypothetical protein
MAENDRSKELPSTIVSVPSTFTHPQQSANVVPAIRVPVPPSTSTGLSVPRKSRPSSDVFAPPVTIPTWPLRNPRFRTWTSAEKMDSVNRPPAIPRSAYGLPSRTVARLPAPTMTSPSLPTTDTFS